MKSRINLSLLMVFFFQCAQSQTSGSGGPSETSSCSNYNSFLTSSTINSLQYYTESINPSSGTIKFDLTKSGEYAGIEALYPLLGVQTGNSFALVKTTPSRFDENKKFFKYQQYYQGIKVIGGGYTVSAIGGTPSDPCAEVYSLSPSIHSGVNVSVSPSIPSSSLGSILSSGGTIKSELVITLNQLGDCQYHLAWRATYNNGTNKESYVDAHSGAILITTESDGHNLASTFVYGQVDLDDTNVGGLNSLISNDGRVKTFENSCPDGVGDYSTADIPTTTNNDWLTSGFSGGVFQSHYAATNALSIFDNIGVDFESLDIAYCNTSEDAFSINDFDESSVKSFVNMGRLLVPLPGSGFTLTVPLATFETVAHEMTHSYLYDFFPYDTKGNKTLHESIADMLATYVESELVGSTEWVIGDENGAIANYVNRDLSAPEFTCYDDVKNINNNPYRRGGPLSYWFYLISTGSPSDGIPALGVEKAAKIVLESLNYLSGASFDYKDLRDATVEMIDNEYGPCSDEGRAVRAAWQKICIPTSNCGFMIIGPEQICEEDDHAQYCISGGPGSSVTYRWYFPNGWTVPGSSGNSIEGNCLTVTNFPKYDWYPRYFKITVMMLGSGLERSKNIRLKDCLGDDPTCEEFHSLSGGGSTDRSTETLSFEQETSKIELIKAYDITGRLLYEGSIEGLDIKANSNLRIIILASFDKNGKFAKADKIILKK